MTTAIVCTALLAALMFVLAIRTSKQRAKAEDQIPTRTDDPLFVAMRAHGNAAENNPLLAVLMLVVGSFDPAVWLEVVMVLVTASRFAHAIGVVHGADMAKEAPLRFVGAIVTINGGILLAVAAAVLAL